MRKITTYLLFLCLYTEGVAQSNSSPAEATALSKTCLERADWYAHSPQFNRDSTLFYFQKAIDVLEKQPSLSYDKLLEVYAKYIEYTYLSGKYSQTWVLGEKANSYYDKISPPSQTQKLIQFDLLQYWALSDIELKNPQKGLATMTLALALLNGDDSPKAQAAYFMGKGRFYQRYNNGIAPQQDWSFASLQKARQLYESFNTPDVNQQLVNIYDNLNWHYNVIEKYDSCDYYAAKIKDLLPSLNNPYLESRYYVLRGNNLYRRKRFDEARTFTVEGIQIMRTYKFTDSQLYVFGLNVMGALELQNKHFDEAERYFNEGRDVSKKINYAAGERNYLTHLYSLYEQKGDFKKALEYYKIYSDSALSHQASRSEKSIRESELQLNVLKQEKELTQQRRVQWLITGVAILLALLLFMLYRSYQFRLKTNRLLAEVNESKTRFYTNITHEFRTPLTVIMGTAENISGHDTERSLIRRNSQNLLTLINQLLDLSKSDSGLMTLNNIQADVIHYLQYLTESFYSMAKEKNIRLLFYGETQAIVMDFDEEKIQQIVYNLLSNAIKFTNADGKIVLHAAKIEQKNKPFLQLKVQDNGIGIAKNALPHIFNRFYQSDNSSTRNIGGTGIGLALTKDLVERMDGTISVESTLERGTEFTVLLPIRLEASVHKLADKPFSIFENAQNTQNISNPDSFGTEGGKNVSPSTNTDEKPMLLIIEDNADVVSYMQSILTVGYDIRIAKNGQQGLDVAFDLIPDIIISDVMMPEKDGYEVCEALKTDARTSHIPIILLTAKSTITDKIAGLKVGADAYLLKPFEKQELLVRLEKLLELRRVLQQNYNRLPVENPTTVTVVESKVLSPLDAIFIQKINAVITKKMSDSNLDILQLCHAVSLSHTQVFRKLKAITGENPSQYIRTMRMQAAVHLLKTTELNISEIAYETGFTDPNYFTRVFSEVFGQPPSAMRK